MDSKPRGEVALNANRCAAVAVGSADDLAHAQPAARVEDDRLVRADRIDGPLRFQAQELGERQTADGETARR